MKEEWLFPGAMVPVDVETTAALVAEIKRLIDVVGGVALEQPKQEPVKLVEYNCPCGRVMKFESEHGVVAPQRTWVGLTDDEIKEIVGPHGDAPIKGYTRKLFDQIEAKLRSKT